jgi:hypothetical protein
VTTIQPIRTTAFLYLASLLLTPVPALAQAPRITGVFPPGARRGASGSITLTGENLKPGSQVLVSGEGVTAHLGPARADPKKGDSALALQLQVAADALPGARELRVLGPDGASNAARITVGTLPEMVEMEPNNKPEEAQSLTALPVTVYGRIDPVGDIDTFRFHAGAGETWVFDLGSVSFGSRLDGYLTLRDASGREMATAVEELDRDPRLIHTFDSAGDYTISVRDMEYRGSPEATYALSIGRLPAVTHVLPLALARGRTTTVQLAGVNLGGMDTMQVSVPADYSGDTMAVVPKTPSGDAPPVQLTVSTLPEWVEKEPNDDPAHATPLPSLPGAVSGVIDHPGDVDVYAFHAAAGQKLMFDLLGRRLGSRLDSFLRITDAKGKELASNDDAVGKDSRLEWTPPAAGDYYVQVSDIAGEGGDDYGYRLEITAPPGPDFKLTVTPDLLNLGQGGTETMTVRAERLNGFTGDVALRVDDLPHGVTASPGTIHVPADAKGDESVQITLTAAADAPRQGFPLRVVGTATIAGKLVEHAAQPMESYQPPGEEGRQQRPTQFQVAGVGEPAPYTVSVDPRQVTLAPGATTKIAVKVARRPDAAAKGEVELDVQNVPGGIDVKAPAIPADKSDGQIELKAPEKLDPQTTNLIVRGRIKAMSEMKKDTVQAAPAVMLTVLPAKSNHEDTKNTKSQ